MKPPKIQRSRLLGVSRNGACWRHHAEIKKGNNERE